MPDRRIEVLLVEDNDGDAFLVSDELGDAGGARVDLHRERDLASALQRLQGHRPDCVLLDLGLPDAAAGLDALHRVLGANPDAAVVVLTGLDDAATAAAAMAAGAQDYVVKQPDIDGVQLLRTLRFAARRGERIATLRASNDELAAFAHTIAHDLRGPLASIVGLTSMLTSEVGLDAATRADVGERIREVTHGLSRLVTGLLSYAETAGEASDEVDLVEVATWVRSLLADRIAAVDATVEVGPLPTIRSNEPALRTVLLNLVGNAIKYRAPDRRLHIEVSAQHSPGAVVLTVGDNGVGIPADRREEVFVLGERAVSSHASAGTAPDGAGIGLASVRRIVLQLGGTVWIEDGMDGDGVRVRLSVPAAPMTPVVEPVPVGDRRASGSLR